MSEALLCHSTAKYHPPTSKLGPPHTLSLFKQTIVLRAWHKTIVCLNKLYVSKMTVVEYIYIYFFPAVNIAKTRDDYKW